MKQQKFLNMDISDEVSSLLHPGKDEMNFAEHPIALLTDRVPKGQRSIKFEDEFYCEKRKKLLPRRRIIEGSEEYGLPTATDDLVILALIQLTKTKQKGKFQQPDVEFTRLELIKLLGWADEGHSYDRIKKSLLRVKGVTYYYDNAWWDLRLKQWTTKAFNIIDNVEINDSRVSHGQGGLFPSRVKWNEVVFDSFQAGFLRNIDFQLCMQLKHPTALRMYRFLGKRFYQNPDWTFDLKEFAHKHIGLGRNYEGGTQLARKLKPAITELETVGFLEPLDDNTRFVKKGWEWQVRFVQKAAALPMPAIQTDSGEPDLVADLVGRGVSTKAAADLVTQFPAADIAAKIEQFDWEMTQPKPPKKPAGYLVKSIRDGYAADRQFVSKAERLRREEAKQASERKAAEARHQEQEAAARERNHNLKVNAYLKRLDQAQRITLEAKVLDAASPSDREQYECPSTAKFRDTFMLGMIRSYLAGAPELEQIAVEA